MARRVARTPIWVWPVLLVLIAGLSGVTGWAFFGPEAALLVQAEPIEGEGEQVVSRLEYGKTYHVWIKKIALEDRMPDGDRWDSGNDSAPDIQFELSRDGERLQKSDARKDAFVARWDPISIDVKDMLINGSTQIDPAGLIQSPLVRYEPGTVLDLTVWDDDATGLDDEHAGVVRLVFGELFLGENTILPSATGSSSVKQVEVVLFPEDLSLTELIRLVSER